MSNLNDVFGESLIEDKKESEEKEKSANLFDILNSIYHSRNFVLDELTDKLYNKYMINKGLSMGQDTIFYAAEMNRFSHISNNMHHDFLNGVVRKRKRFNKWIKSEKDNDIKILKFFMKCSINKAKEVLSLIDENQMSDLKVVYERDYKMKN